MRAEIVLDQSDLFGVGKMHVGQFLEHLCVIGGSVAISDLHLAPTFQRREIMNMLATPFRSYS